MSYLRVLMAIIKKMRLFFTGLFFLICCFFNSVYAATYNLSNGQYPPCNTTWSVSGTTYSCTGHGRVTLASGDILIANSAITISANDGFVLANNTIGSAANTINLVSSYGAIQSSGTNSIFGAITSGSGNISLITTTVTGTITTGGHINLTGGSVSGLVTSSSNTITTNGTHLSGGARAQSGMSITGGNLAGDFVMTSNNAMVLTGVNMSSGSISGASTVTIQGGSTLGSASSAINVSSNSGAITVDNSVVYGNLTAPGYSTVNVNNGSVIYGTCLPNSTPANACNATPPPPFNCPAGISSGITGYYYNNRTLTEPSTAARSDAPIDFNWGTAAPGPNGINADNFSVRWSGYVRVTQSGAYRFQTTSDDGVRLYVNGNLVIDRWNDHVVTTDTTGDIQLVAGHHYSIVLEYYENTVNAVISLRWLLPGASSYVAIPGGPLPTLGAGLYECTPTTKPPVSSCPTTLSAGITGDYFNNQTLTAPVTSRRLDGPINFDWGAGTPGVAGVGDNNFSVRWNGYVRVTQTGDYRFQTNSDDGVRLTVNGDLLINQWNDHSATTHTSAAVNLVAGNSYPILMEYYENGGSAVAQLRWQTPGGGSYNAIPRGSSPVSSAGLYECATTPAAYAITHNATGITCAAEAVTVTAYNTSGVIYNPPAGTVVTLSTTPATGVWVGGNTFTFSGNESSFTKYLRQTTPGVLTIRAESTTAVNTSTITFVDTALRIALNSSLADIPTQIAGVNGNAIAKVISTNPKTGVCEARVASRTLQTGLAFTCNNPTACVGGQSFSVNGSIIAANNNASPVSYLNVNLAFNANGEAPMTINYSDVGQITLHGRLTIPESGNDPALTISASSNAFIVKPYTLAVVGVAQTASPSVVNPATQDTGNGFIPAGEKFTLGVQSRNAAGAITPNFGNELNVSERNKIQLVMGCPERAGVAAPECETRKPDYPVGGIAGNLVIGEDNNADGITDPYGLLLGGATIPAIWNEVGSFRVEPGLSGTGYLGQGNVPYITPSGVIGRFYPDKFELTTSPIVNSCGANFSYMEHPNIGVSYTVNALNRNGDVVQNYDNKDLNFITAGLGHVMKNLNAVLDEDADISHRFGISSTAEWADGVLTFSDQTALIKRARNASDRMLVEAPFKNSLQLGVKLSSIDPVVQETNMTVDKVAECVADCNAHSLGILNEVRFGRLRLDSSFGAGTADLPVNFVTEYWTGSFWVRNTADSCTAISRNDILYGSSKTRISTDSNLNVLLDGGSTTGMYEFIDTLYVKFISGDAGHKFTAPGSAVDETFPVQVNLATYPWLTFDWNQIDEIPTQAQCNVIPPALPDWDCSIRATFGFGSYRGHDRIIYWRELFQ